jgi:hypothetical protein
MAESLQQLARNQTLFREVNERMSELLEAGACPTEFLCECGQTDCIVTIALARARSTRRFARPPLFSL